MATVRKYRVLIASTEGGVRRIAAKGGWTILETTLREFSGLDTNDDNSLGDIGQVIANGNGWVALSFK